MRLVLGVIPRSEPIFAVAFAENSDIVATYTSLEPALDRLARLVTDAKLQDEVGLRVYENGKPVGPWLPASQWLRDRR